MELLFTKKAKPRILALEALVRSRPIDAFHKETRVVDVKTPKPSPSPR